MKMKQLSKKRIAMILIGVMVSITLASLDSTIVGTAMPKIINSLKGFNYYTWPVISYLLCITIAMPLFGKLADIYGFKPIYLFGIIIFLIGSALCGLSQNMIQMAVFRGLQGIGGAILISNTLAIIGILFSPADRAKYLGIVGSIAALASIGGPSLGGVITDNFGWRWVFYVNVPIGILALVIIILALPAGDRAEEKRKIDLPGAITLVAALIPMLLAFTWGGKNYAWSSPQVVGMFSFAFVMLIIFWLIERRAEDPIIPPSLFKSSIFNFSVIQMFLLNSVLMGASIFLPLFVQGVTGTSASRSGAIMTPMMIGLIAGTILSGVTMSKTHKYKLLSIIGFVIASIGALLMVFLGTASRTPQIVTDMVILGAGIGIVTPILTTSAQNAFAENQMGVVTSGVQFFKYIGSTIASAVLGTILTSSMNSGLRNMDTSSLPGNKAVLFKNPAALSNPEAVKGLVSKLPHNLLPAFMKLMSEVKQILSDSIHHVFLICFIIAVLELVIALFMKEIPLSKASAEK